MNAGCYGSYMADHVVDLRLVTRDGQRMTLAANDIDFAYRQTNLPDGAIVTSVRLRADPGDAQVLNARMADQLARRDATQPTKDRSAGSTFRNPAGFSSTGRADDTHDLKAWSLIDRAGLRGAMIGGAQMSEKHSNFMINTGTATAADLENLGEAVRKKVFETHGIPLEWEIMRVGNPAD
jgi:UDP-N-acetylmuramate dehydrogenase